MGEVIVKVGGEEFSFEPGDFVRRIAARKAMPESAWFTPGLRYWERGYVAAPSGSVQPAFIVVIEHQPGIRTVTVEGSLYDKGYHERKTVRISLPYTINIFLVNMLPDGSFALNTHWPMTFYRKLPLADFEDELLVCNLPNVRIDPWNDAAAVNAIGWTCFHNAPDYITNVEPVSGKAGISGESDFSAVNRLVFGCASYMWESDFTTSAGAISAWKETGKKIPEVSTFKKWHEATEKNPNIGLELDWLPHPRNMNLAEVIYSIRSANLFLPYPGFKDGEAITFIPEEKITEKRVKAALKADGFLAEKFKFF